MSPFEAPVPRKLNTLAQLDELGFSPSNSPCSFKSDSQPLLLEDLLDDCFQLSINVNTLCSARVNYARKFEKYLSDLHTKENLAFLIEIFRYEYFYDKIYPENVELLKSKAASRAHFSPSFLNQSLEHFIDSLPFPTSSMRRSRSSSSCRSINTNTSNMFELGFEDPPSNVWDQLKDQNVSSESETSSRVSAASLESESLLADQWNFIMLQFIRADAPEQINLCNKTAREILEQDALACVHNPVVLIKAKVEVMQLLQENAYGSFLQAQKDEMAQDSCEYLENCLNRSKTPVSIRSRTPLPHSAATVSRLVAPVVSPVPLKRKLKFLSHVSTSGLNHSDSSGSGSSLSSFISHFKSHGGIATPSNLTSAPHSTIHSALHSQSTSPVFRAEDIIRPLSTTGAHVPSSPSILGKLWKRKKTPPL